MPKTKIPYHENLFCPAPECQALLRIDSQTNVVLASHRGRRKRIGDPGVGDAERNAVYFLHFQSCRDQAGLRETLIRWGVEEAQFLGIEQPKPGQRERF